MNVPPALKTWFIIHFVADYLAAVPLMIAPEQVLAMLQWGTVDPIATRIVASAFLAIGGVSLIERNASLDVYRVMLKLKLIWSVSAMVGVLIATKGQFALGSTVVFLVFLGFFSVWVYYFRKFRVV